jgi:hypothetical protein
LGCVSWRIVVQEQNALSQFAHHFTRDFLTQTSQFVCIVRTVYGTTLRNMVNHDYPLSIKITFFEAITFLADGTLLNFFKGVSQGASTACSVFVLFWIEVMEPCFILCYDPVDKIRSILVARQKIS